MAGAMAAAVLWSLPLLAAGLLALLRYSFGSLFVVGENVAAALLHSAGAGIGDTLDRLQAAPWAGVAEAGAGVAFSLAAALLAPRRLMLAVLMAVAGAVWSWAMGFALPAGLLAAGLLCGAGALAMARP